MKGKKVASICQFGAYRSCRTVCALCVLVSLNDSPPPNPPPPSLPLTFAFSRFSQCVPRASMCNLIYKCPSRFIAVEVTFWVEKCKGNWCKGKVCFGFQRAVPKVGCDASSGKAWLVGFLYRLSPKSLIPSPHQLPNSSLLTTLEDIVLGSIISYKWPIPEAVMCAMENFIITRNRVRTRPVETAQRME